MRMENHLTPVFLPQRRFLLLKFQKETNEVYASLNLFLSYYYLVTITLLSYGTSAHLMSSINILKASLILTFSLLFFLYLFAFFRLCSKSQEMIDAQGEAAEAFERVIFKYQRKWSVEVCDEAHFVWRNYCKTMPLSPYSFFNLNRSAFLQCMALIFTYLIVLLQFKISE